MTSTTSGHRGGLFGRKGTINLENIDPACAELGLNFTPKVAVKKKVCAALANSFGFGGQNVALVFSRCAA